MVSKKIDSTATTAVATPKTSTDWRNERNTLRLRVDEALHKILHSVDPVEVQKLESECRVAGQQLFLLVGGLELTLLREKLVRAKELEAKAERWRAWADSERGKLAGVTDNDELEVLNGFVRLITAKGQLFSRLSEADTAAVGDLTAVVESDPETWPLRIRNMARNAKGAMLARVNQTLERGRVPA